MLNAALIDCKNPPVIADLLQDDDDDGGAIDTRDILGEVTLARVHSM